MKKLLASVMAGAMLFSASASVFATEAAGLAPAEGSHLVIDRDFGYLDKIDGTITVADLKAKFTGEITVTGADGTAKADDAAVATDDTVAAGEDSIKAMIYGDVNRDGKANMTDASAMLKSIAKWSVDLNTDAADVDKNDKLNLSDVTKLLKKIAKWDDISLGNVRMVFENKKLEAENEDAGLGLVFTSSMLKVARSETEIAGGTYSYKMKMARNEVESCQFYLTADTGKDGLTAELTPFEYEYGGYTLESELLREYYYNLALYPQLKPWDASSSVGDYFAEPLLPNDTSFEVMADCSQGFMINVKADKDAPAGMYKATLNIMDADGKVIKTADVYTYVWDFELPDAPYSKSAFGLTRGNITSMTGASENMTAEEKYAVYYDFLLEYNMTPSELPYDVLDERSDAYMSDPRVTSFRTMPELAGYALTDYFGDGNIQEHAWDPEVTGQKLVDTMKKVNSDPVWADKSYFTIMDEPFDLDCFNRIYNVDNWMKELLGDTDFNLMLCMASNGVYSQSPFVDLVDYVRPIMDYWCPQSSAFTLHDDSTPGADRWNASSRSYVEYGNFADRLDTIMDEKDELWWYICCAPEAPYANFFNFYQGVAVRMVLWQQYMFGVEGILYWDTIAYWGNISKYNYGAWNGDGIIMYPGNYYGYPGVPISSTRMVYVRDSFDDYDYLTMAEEIAGAEAVDKIMATVTTASLDFTEDHTVMEAARDALAKLIVSK